MAGKTGNQKLIEQLLADGFKYMFGNPGTVEQGFLDALKDYPSMRYILTLQESVAVMTADGYARATKQPALVQIHSSPGLGNAIGALYQAKRGHAPLVVIGGDAGISYMDMEAQMYADLVAMAEPATKWSTMVKDRHSLLRIIRRAVKVATTPPMGPVYVCLPADILDQPNDEEVFPSCRLNMNNMPDETGLEEAAKYLCAAKNPRFFIGDGIAYAGAQQEITDLAEFFGASVWGVDAGEMNMDATNPCYRGQTGHMFGTSSHPITEGGDVVLICGTYMLPEVFPELGEIYNKDAKVIHIDWDTDAIAKNHRVDIGLVGNPRLALKRLHELAQQEAGDEDLIRMKERRDALTTVKSDISSYSETAIAFFEELKKLEPDPIIFDEALTGSPLLGAFYPCKTQGRFFQTRGGSLGVGITGAMGVQLAFPDDKVIGVAGDGGTMYVIQGLWTAAREHIPAKFVIMSNHSYGLLKQNIKQYWNVHNEEAHEMPVGFGLEGPDIDFAALARAHGVDSMKVTTVEEAKKAAHMLSESKGAFLVDLEMR